VLFLLGVLISSLSLGGVRLYGLYLEHRLADCAMKMENVGNQYAMLEQSHAALLSPSRVYNYAKTELNMVVASEVETIKLKQVPDERARDIASARTEAVRGPGGLSGLFVGAADAKD
jgi:hypothetical protein